MSPGNVTALVTGASSGIGRELALLCAQDGHDLVLVARRGDRLEEIKRDWSERYGVTVQVVPMDLSEPNAPQRLRDRLEASQTEVGILINNAGFGSTGPFYRSDTATELEMIQVNVTTLTQLTRLWLPDMVHRDQGRILNVASTAALQPGPLMATYYATKAYVLSFSEALSEELRGTGVSVTALCPGPVDTEFQARARLDGTRLIRFGLMDARRVAEEGYRAMKTRRSVVIPGLANKIGALSVRLSPRFLVRRTVKWIQSKVH